MALQADVVYYQRRMQEAQKEISGILGQLGLQTVQMQVVVPEAPAAPPPEAVRLPGPTLVPKDQAAAEPAGVESLPPVEDSTK